jgi:nucleoside phosphorylase
VPFEADFAVLTVVEEALQIAFDILGEADWQNRHGEDWPVWEVDTVDGGRIKVVVSKALDRSNVPAFEAAISVLQAWRPRHLILADIGGGFQGRDDLGVGDLVVGREVEYYSFRKETPEGQELRRYPAMPPTRAPRRALETLSRRQPNWTDSIRVPRPETAAADPPKILPGQIVCGEALLSDPSSETVEDLTERYPEALAVDMESTGVARAVYAVQGDESLFTEFCVLRGISDCIDAAEDNQETRNETKAYAAAVALAVACAYIHNAPSSGSVLSREGAAGKTTPAANEASSYLEDLRAALSATPATGGSDFRLTLEGTRAGPEGSELEEGARVERGQVLDLAMADRLVVVVGQSGTGKSVLLDSIARQLAPASNPLVVRIDLKTDWNPTWADGLADTPVGEGIAESMDALLTASSPNLNVEQLGAFADSHDVLLIVDALNEIPPAVAKKIRLTLNQYARHFRRVHILATDRSPDPDYTELRWTVLTLPELDPDEVKRVIDTEFGDGEYDRQPEVRKEILRIPFFLDRTVKDDTIDFTSRAGAVEGFLKGGGLEPDDLGIAGRVALEVLRRKETALSEDDKGALGDVLEKLYAGNFLSRGQQGPVFSHQLIHQCLAGRQLAASPDLWNSDTMDALTSFAASLDGIGMTIASIEEGEDRDHFLQIVYDWNWSAAVVALSEAQSGDRGVSEAMERAILAMVAEKRFDPVEGTRARVERLLSKVPCETAELLRPMNPEQLFGHVESLDYDDVEWWDGWKEVFLRRTATELLAEESISDLVSDTPLIGWMVANALRRVEGSAEAALQVRTVYRTNRRKTPDARTTRWRAVHALGAWPGQENAELLLAAMGDEYMWCSYGATRSAVEMAARTDDLELRGWVIDRLMEEWPNLTPEPLGQLARASRYRDVDTGWPATIRPLIVAVRDAQEEEERDRWDQRLRTFDEYADGITERA